MRIETRVEALRMARGEVKAAIQREGRVKLGQVPAREITAQAEAYVLSHREIIAEARAKVERWAAEEAEKRRAKLNSSAQRVQTWFARTSVVQMPWAKWGDK
jgi:hypothetical protein